MRAAGLSALVLALLIGPWAWRNYRVLHEPVLLRSNAGLELALADHPGALEAKDRRQDFVDRISAIHPSLNLAAYQRMRQMGGEVAYARALGAEARAWIAANPMEATRLFALHVCEALLPQKWQVDMFKAARSSILIALRVLLINLVAAFGLAGILLGLIRGGGRWLYPAAIVLTLTLALAPFQPVMRYTYLFYPTLVFCAGEALAGLLTIARRKRAGA